MSPFWKSGGVHSKYVHTAESIRRQAASYTCLAPCGRYSLCSIYNTIKVSKHPMHCWPGLGIIDLLAGIVGALSGLMVMLGVVRLFIIIVWSKQLLTYLSNNWLRHLSCVYAYIWIKLYLIPMFHTFSSGSFSEWACCKELGPDPYNYFCT